MSLSKIKHGAGTVALIALLVVGGLCTLSVVRGSWTVTTVLSGSMRPGLPVGGVVVAERIPTDHIALRDVLVFAEPDHPDTQVVHRVVGIDVDASGQRVFETQGDANSTKDMWKLRIREPNAYRVRWSVPLLGYAAQFVGHGIALLVGGALLVVVALSSLRRRGTPKDDEASADEQHDVSPVLPSGTSDAAAELAGVGPSPN